MTTIFEEIDSSIFDKKTTYVSKEDTKKEDRNINIEDRAIYVVKYRKLYTSDSKHLAVVRRIGWDSKAGIGGSSNKFYVMHTPTRVDLGIVFNNEADARSFVSEIDKKWDWSATDFYDSNIDMKEVYKFASEKYGNSIIRSKI